MKSAYELAMERLEKESPTARLTEQQKAEIAEIDSVAKAKSAEKEVFLRDLIVKAQAVGKFDEVAELEQQLQRELRRINDDAETKKERIRQGKK
jgi:phosphomevalonate kinase